MHCLKCGCEESKVEDSRMVEEWKSIRRRRGCLECKNRFTNYERSEYTPIMVIKKNGVRQQFDRAKIISGMLRSCEKRPVSTQTIEKAADEIEAELNNMMIKEIKKTKIGDMVIEKLKALDEIAFVRFASVYKHFENLEEFINEVKKIGGDLKWVTSQYFLNGKVS